MVLTQYEAPANQGEDAKRRRASFGQTFYDKFVRNLPLTTANPYKVRVTADVLNVRKSPTTSSAVVTTVRKNEVYTTVGESDGWGKLKSGVGWICLDYAVRT